MDEEINDMRQLSKKKYKMFEELIWMDQFWMQEHTALMFFMGSLFNWEWSEEAKNWRCNKYRSKFEEELRDGENGGI